MPKGNFPIEKFKNLNTPFYYYDTTLLRETLEVAQSEASKYGYHIHYAIKANANKKLLDIIKQAGIGLDCVSGGELKAGIEVGFSPDRIMFAGVGKTDDEINIALDNNIGCFNVESVQELEIINSLAIAKGKTANIALRANPNVDAHTHAKITTGTYEDKFGINIELLPEAIKTVRLFKNIKLVGLHFHIGSQITDISTFEDLCVCINELQDELEASGEATVQHINIGGGLAINYEHPNHLPVPDFETYFRVFNKHLKLRKGQHLHCEPGRALVAQSGTLITRVLYVKKGITKQFAVVDAGFSDLIRPAMYDAYHRIENITSEDTPDVYDVVGPICESSDVFGKERKLNCTKRGDLIAIRSAGAYGESMASQYNLRPLPKSYMSEEF
ncbi:MAG: diaminopimelate decarboxylase [Bacteroidales bacterium]|jgi:diaminopimelate decarboxylase|nr:diaminopimelate decarboxylase [Bacteroidales bacterium]